LFRGNRDEGILFISAYRVCQKKGTKAGVNTAFMQQIEGMIDEELKDSEELAGAGKSIPQSVRRSLDPRDRLLQDLKQLITEHRSKGFRPILFMDANKDWTKKSGSALQSFLQETQLQDPLYERFHNDGLTALTYARGTSRIDYMFFDEALLPAIKRIGTLGLHEALVSDHVMLYVDLDKKELFQGLIN
jgi:exonuclease III